MNLAVKDTGVPEGVEPTPSTHQAEDAYRVGESRSYYSSVAPGGRTVNAGKTEAPPGALAQAGRFTPPRPREDAVNCVLAHRSLHQPSRARANLAERPPGLTPAVACVRRRFA